MNILYYLTYFLLINLFTYALFYVDKQRAINHQYRISEKILINLILIGGFVGAYFGMYHFHHKTKKTKFKIALISGVVIFGLLLYSIYNGGRF